MLSKDIRKFLSNIGTRGGKKTAATHDMAEIGRLGGLKASENRKKRSSTGQWKPYGQE